MSRAWYCWRATVSSAFAPPFMLFSTLEPFLLRGTALFVCPLLPLPEAGTHCRFGGRLPSFARRFPMYREQRAVIRAVSRGKPMKSGSGA